MSAIFGINFLGERPVSSSALEQMSQVLAHRGPDGSGIWCNGSVGLGHRALKTTPESVNEQLPLKDPTGQFVITADARLDNREELIKELRLSEVEPEELTDTDLILAAYLHWREGCAARLLGDFVFAIWDERDKKLFCARDHFGVRPFYYHHSSNSQIFAFATEIKALFTLPEVPRKLNEVRLGDHIADVFADQESTFYRDVLRLPAAHTMTITRNGIRKERYWTLDPTRELKLRSNEEYAERFRELFTEAVRCRLRSTLPLGSMLSGGLDSSSITCTARRLLSKEKTLCTFSTVFDNVPRCDEREYINAVLAGEGFDPHFIQGDQNGPFRDIDRIHWHEDQAFYAPNFAMIWRIYKTVSAKGVKVLLDGHDGDSVVSHGYKYLDELAIAGRWLSLTKEIRGLSKHYGDSSMNLLRTYGWHYGFDPLLARHKSLRLLAHAYRGLARGRSHQVQEPQVPGRDWQDLMNPDFAVRTNMAERYKGWRKTLMNSARTERDAHYRILAQPLQPFALEVHDGAAAAFGIEKRYPFWDRRVVEFCLSLPGQQKLSNGWTRMVMRRAMEDILPKKIQWRGGKMDFAASLSYGMKTFERDLLTKVIVDNPEAIEQYVNIDVLRQSYKRFLAAEPTNSLDLFNIWKCTSLALWLQSACTLKGGDRPM